MTSSSLIWLFGVVVLTVTSSLVDGAQKFSDAELNCDTKNNDKVDRILAKIMVIGEHGRKYPETKKQLKVFCEESSKILAFADQYKNRCFKGTLKQFSSLFIYSNRNSMRRFCGKKGSKQLPKLLKDAHCVNQNLDRLGKCMNRMTTNFVGIKYAEDKKKIPHICCQYVNLVECFREEMAKTECNSETETFLNYLRSVMTNFTDGCGDYNEDSDMCTKLGTPPKPKTNEKAPKSILYPLYEIINSLPQ